MANKKKRERAVAQAENGEEEEAKEEEEMQNNEYEKVRKERIKENLERIQRLGINDLSRNLILLTSPKRRRRPPLPSSSSSDDPPLLPSSPPKRRSSRLQGATPVSYAYAEVGVGKREKTSNKELRQHVVVVVAQGEREEVYTQQHAALLGSCETTWTLFVDGCDHNGKRIYDQVNGKTCHQCRQKTLGHHTRCSKCNLVQGQFCGDCLYMRYGENVLEAEKNVNWICPVCRGICNCSLCRTKKGWAPTGSLYRKVVRLGFKSVAHYLIQTRQKTSSGQTCAEVASSSEALITSSNTQDVDGLKAVDPNGDLKSETADPRSSNYAQMSLMSVTEPEMPSLPRGSTKVEINGVEEVGKDLNSEVGGSEKLDEHSPSHSHTKAIRKEPGAVEKLQAESVGGRVRLRKRVAGSPTTV